MSRMYFILSDRYGLRKDCFEWRTPRRSGVLLALNQQCQSMSASLR